MGDYSLPARKGNLKKIEHIQTNNKNKTRTNPMWSLIIAGLHIF